MAADIPELIVPDAAAWRRWLARTSRRCRPASGSCSPRRAPPSRPASPMPRPSTRRSVTAGSTARRRRATSATYRQRFTPRRARSRWSARNVGIISRLRAEGRMHPAGEAEVERAQGDGRWEAAYAGLGFQRSAARPRRRAARTAARPGDVRDPDQPEPLRDPLPDQRRQAAGDPRARASTSSSRCWPAARPCTRRSEPSEGRPSAAARWWRAAGWRHTEWCATER